MIGVGIGIKIGPRTTAKRIDTDADPIPTPAYTAGHRANLLFTLLEASFLPVGKNEFNL
jgi:hypothetical protein